MSSLFAPEPPVQLGPSGRIILLDLNVALTSNFGMWNRSQGTFANWISGGGEKYRGWLVDLLRDEWVVLMTHRHVKYKAITLQRLMSDFEWIPDDAHFRPEMWKNHKPEEVKEEYLTNYVFPAYYGIDYTEGYLAIESNSATRTMYKRHHIEAVNAHKNDARPPASIQAMMK